MKKNKIVMSVISGLLVAAVAVGGTLAYLSDKSNVVTNTFNVGDGYVEEGEHQGLWLDETDITDPDLMERTEKGNNYRRLTAWFCHGKGSYLPHDRWFH